LPFSYCDAPNQSNPIEIGAEIFAAELIYPDQDFAAQLVRMGVQHGTCTPEILVRLKHEIQTTLSYAGLAKRSEFMGFAQPGSLAGVKWKSSKNKSTDRQSIVSIAQEGNVELRI
jgi:Zn-dependent peptidase ImmA (M78 family)